MDNLMILLILLIPFSTVLIIGSAIAQLIEHINQEDV